MKTYFPVLKGKRGEFPALKHLQNKTSVVPLIEHVPNADPVFVPTKMSSVWPDDRPYFLDMLFDDDAADLDEEEIDRAHHPLSLAFASGEMKKGIPVTGISRSKAYQEAVNHVLDGSPSECAIRLHRDDFDDEEELEEAIENLTRFLNLHRSNVTLFVDCGDVQQRSAGTVAREMASLVANVPFIDEWKDLVVLAASFPHGLSSLSRNWNRVERSDWKGWRQLITKGRGISRLPNYGDYCISSPSLPPTGRATILAQIRYTADDEFLIFKGEDVQRSPSGFSQFYDICAELVEFDEFEGPDFSFGDLQISEKAARNGSSGNAETWRTIGVSHHIEKVLDQLSSLRGA